MISLCTVLLTTLSAASVTVDQLPAGWAPDPVALPHFPDRLHAYVFRNWELAPMDRLASVIGTTPEKIRELGHSMGLEDASALRKDWCERTYITILRRNWHLLPYEQLIALVDWTPAQMEYALREGDGLFWWFGSFKPKLEPLRYAEPSAAAKERASEIAQAVRELFPQGAMKHEEPLLTFVDELAKPIEAHGAVNEQNVFNPRFIYSYFGAFRDAILSEQTSYPDGYLARLAERGVNGIWLPGLLNELAPFPWDSSLDAKRKQSIEHLRSLVTRAKQHGIGVYLYLNEPRPMPMAFFEKHPELKGIEDKAILAGQVATLCTSLPEVQAYLRDSVAAVCAAAPDLAGFFTITASESYTNCWSHHDASACARCSKRKPEEVIAEVNTCLAEGIAKAGTGARLIAWDWGWKDEWAAGILDRLPKTVAFQSVSEWSIPLKRGGVETQVGEYSLSVVGPGPRATRHWALARERGLDTIAKIQGSCTWELATVPYIPVVENVGNHVANLRSAGVKGLMLSWTLGCYPSPNLEVITELGRRADATVDDAMMTVAVRRYGNEAGPAVVTAWKAYSKAFSEFPFCGAVLYDGPVHMGPANLLWGEPTQFRGRGTMAFGCPFDDLDDWRGPYPREVFADQFEKVAKGFEEALNGLKAAVGENPSAALAEEMRMGEACSLHFRSAANQCRFVILRDSLPVAKDKREVIVEIEEILKEEIELAVRLHALQSRDSRLGYEAACQYFYVGTDLVEKVINCRDLLKRWLPTP